MFKNLLILFVVVAMAQQVFAQQNPLYSHYVNNELLSNPAYAGSKGMMEIGLLYRTQWVGFDGAPKTLTAAIHSPIPNKNFALGFSLFNDQIGIDRTTGFNIAYAYHVPLNEKLKWSFGFQGTFFFQKRNINELDAVQSSSGDLAYSDIKEKSFLMNFGAGTYLYGKNFAVGIGVPNILEGGWFSRNEDAINQQNHYFITGAYQIDISDPIKIQPTAALRFTKGAPMQFEGNLNLIFYDMVLVGGGFRSDKSAILMLNYFLGRDNGIRNKIFKIGYAYDLAFKELRDYTSGSHEVILSFGLSKKGERHISPRYY